jgi:hypothetical protein
MREALGGLKAEGGGPGAEPRKSPAARRKKLTRESAK